MAWKFYEDDGITEDCYLEAFLPNVDFIDGNILVMRINRNSKKFSKDFKFEVEAYDSMKPLGENLVFSDAIKDISELDGVLDELRFTIHKDFIYPTEEELEQLLSYELPQDTETSNEVVKTSDEESEKFAWEVVNDYIHPDCSSTYNGMVPQLVGRNLENPLEEVRLYLDPSQLDELEDNKSAFILEIANGIDDIEFLTGFSSFADALESVAEWQETQNSEHNLVENFVRPDNRARLDFFRRNEELLKHLEEEKAKMEISSYDNFFIYTDNDEVLTVHDTLKKIEDNQDMDYIVDNMIIKFFNSEEKAKEKAEELKLKNYTVETY